MKAEPWKEIAKKGEVKNCEKCGKMMWKFWYNPRLYEKNKNIGSEKMYPEMAVCAPCFFKK